WSGSNAARTTAIRRLSRALLRAMAGRIERTLQPKTDVKPLDVKTAERIGRVARAETVELNQGNAVFGFSPSETDTNVARGNVEMAARFELHRQGRFQDQAGARRRAGGARRGLESPERAGA